MKKGFTELPAFTRWVTEFLSDGVYADLQLELMTHPTKGEVMPGCGGLRKLRVGDARRGKGKRGGARVIYLHVEEVNRIIFVVGYSKEVKSDLTPEEKHELKQLADELKAEEIRWARKKP